MKILHLIHSLEGGGAERQLCYLAPELASLGHEIHICYHQKSDSLQDLTDVTLHKIDIGSNYSPELFFKISQLTRKLKPDLINTWIMQMDIVGGVIAKWLKIPWVLREPSSKNAYSSSIKFFLRKRIAHYAEAIISNSQNGDFYWQDTVPDQKRHIIRNGIPVEKIFNTESSDLSSICSAAKHPFIMTASRISADKTGNKNLMCVLEAIRTINQQMPLYAIICGQGHQMNELKAFAKENKLCEKIFFPGNLSVELIWSLMKKAKAFVTMSEFEGCPNTVMEAMASKCPLIVSDIPAHREILNNNCALFVKHQQIQGLTKALLNLFEDPEATNVRLETAFKKIQNWTIKAMAKNYEKVYYSLI